MAEYVVHVEDDNGRAYANDSITIDVEIDSSAQQEDVRVRSFTQKELKVIHNNEERSVFFDQAVHMKQRIEVHSDGVYPTELIDCRRPNEAEEAKAYRKKIYVEKTKPTFDRIQIFLNKIRRSPEWSITYHNEEQFARIKPEDRLSVYSEKEFPNFTSVTNWIFKVCLKKYLVDPNAVIFVKPMLREIFSPTNEHLRPVPTVFTSENVLQYKPGRYAVLNSIEGAYYNSNGKIVSGKSFYIITRWWYYRFDQINSRGDFAINEQQSFNHNLGVLPVFKLQAVVKDQYDDQVLYESRIAGMLPELDEAVREYSDLQAARVLHQYPERYEYTNTECRECLGTGKRKVSTMTGNEEFLRHEHCTECDGRGYTVGGPYAKHVITPSGLDEQQIPTPPIGYVTKDIAIITIQNESVEKHIYDALAAVNMELIARTPDAESGIAKAYDHDGSNNTLHAIGEDIVYIMDRLYLINALYRYVGLYSADEIIDEMLPQIAVPERFDIATTGMLEEEIKSAREGKMNPELISQMERDYAGKRFYGAKDVQKRLELILELDPLANISEEDKNIRLMNRGITKSTYVISSNIAIFVKRATEEHKDFADMPESKQREIIAGYAKELIDAEAAAQVNINNPEDDIFAGEGGEDNSSDVGEDDPDANKNNIPE